MKTFANKVRVFFLIIILSGLTYSSFDIVDNRDYEGDMYEVYFLGDHIGYVLGLDFELSVTGR